MRKKILLITYLLSVASLHAGVWSNLRDYYDHYRAVNAYDNNNKQNSKELLDILLIDNPHDAIINYDAGITHHRLEEFELARHCFQRSVEKDGQSSEFLQQAYFNLGNTLVELHELDDAISAYEQVLTLSADHEKAQHNLDLVKKMLEEQKRQQQQQQDNQGDNHNNQQSQNPQGNSGNQDKQGEKQEKKDAQENQESEGDQNKRDEQNNDENGSGERRHDDSEKNREGDSSDQDATEDPEQGERDSDNADSDEQDIDEQQEGENQSSDDAQNNDQKNDVQHDENQKENETGEQKEFDDKEEKSPDRSDIPRNDTYTVMPQSAKEQADGDESSQTAMQPVKVAEAEDNNTEDDNLDKQTALLLTRVAQYDEENCKKMVREHVQNTMRGGYGQKNW